MGRSGFPESLYNISSILGSVKLGHGQLYFNDMTVFVDVHSAVTVQEMHKNMFCSLLKFRLDTGS